MFAAMLNGDSIETITKRKSFSVIPDTMPLIGTPLLPSAWICPSDVREPKGQQFIWIWRH